LDQCAHEICEFLRTSARGRKKLSSDLFGKNTREKMLQNHRVAGNVPSRGKPHAALAIRKNLNPLRIESVETGVGENAPVGRLQVVQAFYLMFARELTGGFGRRLKPVKEIAKARLAMLVKLRPMTTQEIAGPGVQTGER
jgi:hypothetical protein